VNFLLLSISIYLLVYLQAIKNINMKNKKKYGACVFWAPVFFLRLLAGKLENFQTEVTTWNTNKIKKNGACVFWAPVFFLSLLAGKLEQIERRLPWQQLRQNNVQIVGSIKIWTTTFCVQNVLINSSQIKWTCSWKRLLKSLHWNDFAR